jgi:hypothetical protein
MARTFLIALLLLATTAPAAPTLPSAPPPAVPPPPSPAEAARMAGGEVLLAARPVGTRGLDEEIGRGVIDAPAERVYAALIDFAHYQEWVPFVTHSTARPQGDGSVVSFQGLSLPFPLGGRHYEIHARFDGPETGMAPAWRVWWTYVPGTGNVADHYGWWVLEPVGAARTRATCLLYTDPGRTPAWAMHRGAAATMPYIFSGLRQQILRSRYDRP